MEAKKDVTNLTEDVVDKVDVVEIEENVEKKAKKHGSGFMEFIREQGVVGLAVGFILGGAAASMVSAITDDLLDPIIGIFIGSEEGLQMYAITLAGAEFKIGHLLFTLIDFIVIAFVVYILVKLLKVEKLDKKSEAKK